MEAVSSFIAIPLLYSRWTAAHLFAVNLSLSSVLSALLLAFIRLGEELLFLRFDHTVSRRGVHDTETNISFPRLFHYHLFARKVSFNNFFFSVSFISHLTCSFFCICCWKYIIHLKYLYFSYFSLSVRFVPFFEIKFLWSIVGLFNDCYLFTLFHLFIYLFCDTVTGVSLASTEYGWRYTVKTRRTQ